MKRMIWFVFSFFLTVKAKDLGTFGEQFEIAEIDLLEEIAMKLQEFEKTGELKAVQERIQRMVQEMIQRPRSISGITHTEEAKKFTYDPTMTTSRDLRDHRGHIFVRKGERFNPLDKIPLSKPLLFIDGDSEGHIQWAISKITDPQFEGHDNAKVILVKGAPLKLRIRLKRDIFFDQSGILTKQLGIKHVPAIVFQKKNEKVLTIHEDQPRG
ncbi:MAG: type-F conjugative transfer system protein TraW [Holosporaceae bacterium]|jgi:conjugal transfer pilus assembly protein TraW|nr:type-F conjugative transfer system protein TraW [Holosporaceae bacterium]